MTGITDVTTIRTLVETGDNSTDYITEETPLAGRIVEGIVLIIICLLSVVGNFSLWLIVCLTKNLRTLSNMLLLCLSTADLLVSVFNMPMTVYTILVGEWRFSTTVCTVQGFVNMTTFIASVMSLAAISWNRYIAICKSMSFKIYFNKKNTVIVVIAVWVFALLLATPPLLGWGAYGYLPRQSFCFCDWATSVSYTFFMVAVCFGGPCISMAFCYVGILKEVRSSRRRVHHFDIVPPISKTETKPSVRLTFNTPKIFLMEKPNKNGCLPAKECETTTTAKSPENCPAEVTVPHKSALDSIKTVEGQESKDTSNNRLTVPSKTQSMSTRNSRLKQMTYQQRQIQKKVNEDLRLALSLLVVVVIFIIAWFPFCIMMFWSVFSPENPPPRTADMFSLLLGYANSCCNPIVYGLMNKRFNTAFKKLFKCQCKKVLRIGMNTSSLDNSKRAEMTYPMTSIAN